MEELKRFSVQTGRVITEGDMSNHLHSNSINHDYRAALKKFKQIEQKIKIFHNKNLVMESRLHAQKNIPAQLKRQRQQRLLIQYGKEKQNIKQKLQIKKQEKHEQIRQKYIKNFKSKIQHSRVIQDLKRVMTQSKFRRHDQIKHRSMTHSKKIENQRKQQIKNKRNCRIRVMMAQEQQKRNIVLRTQSKMQAIKIDWQAYTSKIIKKTKNKQKELEQLQVKYQNKDQQSQISFKRTPVNRKRIVLNVREPFTQQNRIQSSISNPQQHFQQKTSIKPVIIS